MKWGNYLICAVVMRSSLSRLGKRRTMVPPAGSSGKRRDDLRTKTDEQNASTKLQIDVPEAATPQNVYGFAVADCGG